jgi:hypothetical protein
MVKILARTVRNVITNPSQLIKTLNPLPPPPEFNRSRENQRRLRRLEK